MNLTNLFLLSNMILNFEKISFLPRMNGLFSLLDNAQVISTGVFVILTVILARYAMTPLPSMPQKRIFGSLESPTPKSPATDLGIIVQSAPVSTKKSNFWYPYLVKTAIGTIGSGIIPNCVYFWFRGKLARINTDCAFGRDEANNQTFPVNMLLEQLFRKLEVGFGMGNNLAISSANVFSGVVLLQPCVGNSFHNFYLAKKDNIEELSSQGKYGMENGIMSLYYAALALQLNRGELEAGQIAQRAIGLQ